MTVMKQITLESSFELGNSFIEAVPGQNDKSHISHPIVPVKRRGRDKKLRRSYSTSAMMNTRPTIDKPAKSCISSPKKSGVEIPLAVQPQKRQILRKDVSRATNKQTELTVSARQTKLTSLGVQRTATNSSKDCIEKKVSKNSIIVPIQDLPKPNESGFSTDVSGPLEQVASPRTKLQTKLTSLGIRRTARQFLKELARERESDYLRSLRDNIETGMRVIMTEEKGRGVVASRLFIQDEFVVEYAGELISEREGHAREKEYKQNPELGSYMFFFVHAGQRYCVDATKETPRLGRLINHSRLRPNCAPRVIFLDGLPRLTLFTKRPVNPGEEFLYDYGDRDKETLEAHPWLKTT